MAICAITLENFKPFGSRKEIELAPITVLIGGNSSGKSSIVHALAVLKQTATRKTTGRALVLDGPEVLVSLGRYSDAVYSHDYKRQIGLGIAFEKSVLQFDAKGRGKTEPRSMKYFWKFGGTRKTQRVRLATRTTSISGRQYTIRGKDRGTSFDVSFPGVKTETSATVVQNLGFVVRPFTRGSQLNMEDFFAWENLNRADEAMLSELEKVRYLGPFREPPRRLYPYHGPVLEVGRTGEQAVPMLVDEFTASSRSRPNMEYVTTWLERMGLVTKMELKRQGASDSFRLTVRGSTSGIDAAPADIGYGFSQALPVLVQGAFAEPEGTLIFEQPEIHLHPAAQRELGAFFVDVLRRSGGRILIETHSRDLLRHLQAAIREGRLQPEELKVILLTSGEDCPSLREYHGDEEGDLWDRWDVAFPENWDVQPNR